MTHLLHDIRTARCRIAPLEDSDAPALAAITDASVTERIHFLPAPFTPDHARALIRAGGGAGRFHGIWSREGTALLGAIGVHPAPHRREIEIGYWLAAAARGQGLATEAQTAMLGRLALRHADCRIVAECHPANARSLALLERAGFRPTGRAGRRPGRVLLVRQAPEAGRIDVC